MYALITGATSGIGLEIAKILANMQYNLILVGRRTERLEQISKDLSNKYNIEVDAYTCNLANIDQCSQLLEYTNKYTDIYIVINAAGFGKVGYVENSIDKDDIEMLEDLISLAVNDNVKKIEKETESKMGKFGGLSGLM